MLAVPPAEAELRAAARRAGLSLAAVNAPALCVVSGPARRRSRRSRGRCDGAGVDRRPLHTSHAFHSAMMEPVARRVRASVVASVALRPPRFRTSRTSPAPGSPRAGDRSRRTGRGTCAQPVRFADGVATLARATGRCVLLEVGPGQHAHLARPAARRRPRRARSSRRCAIRRSQRADAAMLLGALGRLWLAGVPDRLGRRSTRDERRTACRCRPIRSSAERYWVEPGGPAIATRRAADSAALDRRNLDRLVLSSRSWKRRSAGCSPASAGGDARARAVPWLVFDDGSGLGEQLAAQSDGAGAAVVTVRGRRCASPDRAAASYAVRQAMPATTRR